jgi:hypothetical protein
MRPAETTTDSPPQLGLFDCVSNGSGGYIITPKKPTFEASVKQAADYLKISDDGVRRLMDLELLEFRKPTPRKTWITWESLIRHKVESKDPEYWDKKRKIVRQSAFYFRN